MGAEQLRAALGMVPGLDSTQFGRLLIEQDRVDAAFSEDLQQIAPGLADQTHRGKSRGSR